MAVTNLFFGISFPILKSVSHLIIIKYVFRKITNNQKELKIKKLKIIIRNRKSLED